MVVPVWLYSQDAHYPQHFFLGQGVAVVGAQGDAVVVGVVRTVVEVVVEGVFVRVVVQVFDGLAFAGDEADAVFSGVEVEDLVQRRAVRTFQRVGDENELVCPRQ